MIAKLLMALTMVLSALHGPGAADVLAAGEHYVMVDQAGILTLWAESNGEPGLQHAPVRVLGMVVSHPDTKLHL